MMGPLARIPFTERELSVELVPYRISWVLLSSVAAGSLVHSLPDTLTFKRIILPASRGAGLKSFKIFFDTYTIHLKTLQSNQRRTILEMILGFLKLHQKWSYEDKGEITFQVWCPRGC